MTHRQSPVTVWHPPRLLFRQNRFQFEMAPNCIPFGAEPRCQQILTMSMRERLVSPFIALHLKGESGGVQRE
jgi:hypothetical protein